MYYWYEQDFVDAQSSWSWNLGSFKQQLRRLLSCQEQGLNRELSSASFVWWATLWAVQLSRKVWSILYVQAYYVHFPSTLTMLLNVYTPLVSICLPILAPFSIPRSLQSKAHRKTMQKRYRTLDRLQLVFNCIRGNLFLCQTLTLPESGLLQY